MSNYIDLSESAARRLSHRLVPYVDAVSHDLRGEIVTTMDPGPSRTGREYPVPGTGTIDPETGRRKRGTGVTYRASAPGEPPAVRTGAYRDSWQVLPPVIQGDQVKGGVASDAMTEDGQHFIGEVLEYGTNDGKIAPRPHIRTALDEVAQRWGGVVRTGEG